MKKNQKIISKGTQPMTDPKTAKIPDSEKVNKGKQAV
jgi:hypothetical protein